MMKLILALATMGKITGSNNKVASNINHQFNHQNNKTTHIKFNL